MQFDGRVIEGLETRLAKLKGPSEDVALVEEIVRSMDLSRLDELGREHAEAVLAKPASMYKYIEPVVWTHDKLKIVKQIGLHKSKPLRIWDIGAGPTHFAKICRHFGHEVVSTDIEVPVYDEIASALGERRTVSAILPGVKTPDLGGKFDLVTAIAINFNWKSAGVYWTLEDWKFLLRDLLDRQLRYPGRIWLSLNHEIHGDERRFNPELMDYMESLGAVVTRERGYIDWKLKKRPKKL